VVNEINSIVLVGPTGVGKTDLAIKLNNLIPSELISVDSVQVYQNLDIGSGKPSESILNKHPHKLINIIPPAENYSTGLYRKDCLKAIEDTNKIKKIPILVGGTMLYFKSIFEGLSILPPKSNQIRQEIEKEALKNGWNALHKKLEEIDPISAKRIHPNDSQRIQRALEVFRLTQIPLSKIHSKNNRNSTDLKVHKFALIPESREEHRSKVSLRFKQMLEQGLVNEVEDILSMKGVDKNSQSLNSIGYKQVCQFLDNEISYDEMVTKAINSTRQFAKRQMTWIRSLDDIISISDAIEDRVSYIMERIK
tara:strand:+ start:42716 stop:43639 length:924 start_codon:yes stop_codon:yes gene_type:complete